MKFYRSSEIMRLDEDGKISKGTLLLDQDGNEFVYTGKSFQSTRKGNNKKYYGLCSNDLWVFTMMIIKV